MDDSNALPPAVDPATPVTQPLPWEDPAAGAVAALIETVKLFTVRPQETFGRLSGEGIGRPYLYALIMAWIELIAGCAYWFVFQAPFFLAGFPEPEYAMADVAIGAGMAALIAAGLFVLMPVFVMIGVLLHTCIRHLMLLLLGECQRGSESTFRLLFYAHPAHLVYGNVDVRGRYMEDLLGLVAQIDAHGGLSDDLREAIAARKREIEYDFLVEDSRKLIRSIRSGAERTAGIVRDLKAFSRTGGGDLQETDIVSGIETTLNLIAPLLKNRVEVERDFAPNLPKIVCNAGHVNQVFMNILTNAAQAIDGEGSIRVSIGLEPGGDAIRVVICDSGPGIKQEFMEKILDPFFTTKEVGEGTGLGLSISDNIVRAHGGRLSYDSTPGTGAAFTVVLPLRPPFGAHTAEAHGDVRS